MQGINFLNFTIHMTIGALFVMAQTYFHLRFVYRTINDLRVTEPEDIAELRNDIVLWQRAAESLSSSKKDEDLVREILLRKINRLQLELNRKITCGSISTATYKLTLEDLQAKVCECKALLMLNHFIYSSVSTFSIRSGIMVCSSNPRWL